MGMDLGKVDLDMQLKNNSTEILVSISCLTYNHASYIRTCLDSFLMQQTRFAFEVIIHDDASTDATKEIIEEYTAKYPDIFFPMYQIENQYSQGIKPTPTFNFPRCRGKYIALCEGDDYWTDPLKLQKQVSFLEANEEYSYCGHKSFALKDEVLTPIEIIEKEISLQVLLNKNILNTATLVFRKSCIEASAIFLKNAPAGDWLLQLLALRTGNGYVMDHYMSVYREHIGGVWSSLSPNEMCEKGVITLKQAKLIFNDKKIDLLIDKAIIERRQNFNVIQFSFMGRMKLRIIKLLKLDI